MIRVTIIDPEQTISFLANQETIMRLIAGCSVNPANMGELLIAADIYQRGIAAAVMADLMKFDKIIHQKGAGFVHGAIKRARAREEAFKLSFQVIDEVTAEEAYDPRGGELVAIDLTRQVIRHSAGLEITYSGEVNVAAEKRPPTPIVTYILPESWKIQNL